MLRASVQAKVVEGVKENRTKIEIVRHKPAESWFTVQSLQAHGRGTACTASYDDLQVKVT